LVDETSPTRTPIEPSVLVTFAIGVAGPLMDLLHPEARSRIVVAERA
jgi:hypothetical protein